MPAAAEPEVAFLDTNIWFYAFVAAQDRDKNAAARKLVERIQPVTSVQIINELCVNLISKAKYPEPEIRKLVAAFYARYLVVDLGRDVLMAASRLRQQYSFSFWDSLVVASARSAEVPVLYSEDLKDGLVVEDDLRIVNPLR